MFYPIKIKINLLLYFNLNIYIVVNPFHYLAWPLRTISLTFFMLVTLWLAPSFSWKPSGEAKTKADTRISSVATFIYIYIGERVQTRTLYLWKRENTYRPLYTCILSLSNLPFYLKFLKNDDAHVLSYFIFFLNSAAMQNYHINFAWTKFCKNGTSLAHISTKLNN